MLRLSKSLANYIRDEFLAAIAEQNQNTLRLYFAGAPVKYLDEVFENLSDFDTGLKVEREGKCQNVFIFQVDEEHTIPVSPGRACKGSESGFINLRNNNSIQYSVILNSYSSQIQSLGSAVRPIGITGKVRSAADWLNTPLLQRLLQQIFSSTGEIIAEARLRQAINFSVEKAWIADEHQQSHGRHNCWSLFERLLHVVGEKKINLTSIGAALGLFSCPEDDFGRQSHLKVVDAVLDYFYDMGIKKGFADVREQGKFLSELDQFENGLAESGVLDANDFVRDPIGVISSLAPNVDGAADWWQKLDTRFWLDALDVDDPKREQKVSYAVRHTIDLKSSGLPIVVRDFVEIELTSADERSAHEVTVERSNGSSPYVNLGTFGTEADTTFLDNDIPPHKRYLRYKLSADGYQDTVFKVVVLNSFEPGVVVDSAALKKNKLFLEKRVKGRQKTPEIVTELHFSSMGYHKLDIYYSDQLDLPSHLHGKEVDAEDSEVKSPVTLQGEGHAVVEIETDEECTYYFNASAATQERSYVLQITAADSPPKGVASEFERLLLLNAVRGTRQYVSARPEVRPSRRVNLEGYLLSNQLSYAPIILAPDSLDSGGDPWSSNRPPSLYSLPHELWDRDWLQKVPDDFKDARAAVIESMRNRNKDQTDSLAAFQLHDDELVMLVSEFLAAYKRWAQTDYSSAIWADVVALVEKQPHADVLENKPTAVILTPLHPIRLAWQVNAQSILHGAYYAEKPCPIASELTPHHFPDCLSLPCTTSAGDLERHAFVALHSSNPYWSVLWSLSDLRKLHTRSASISILGSLDITVDGLAKGFKEAQVKRAIDEVKRLKSAASTLFLTVEGKSGEAASFNSGVLDWVSENLGPDSESNHWKSVGGMALSVSDRRGSESFPELSALSAASELSDGALTWSTFSDSHPTSHLGVITQLSATTETGERTQLRSGTDSSGLARRRLRQVQPSNQSFLIESIIGQVRDVEADSSLASQLLSTVGLLESECLGDVEGISFSPNMAQLDDIVNSSNYTAISSSNIDTACFFNLSSPAYLWDYELPSFGKVAGGSEGYYLLARRSDAMLDSVRGGLEQFAPSIKVADDSIFSLLDEIPKRGMPTLKRLTSGGKAALGELGMLAALKLLQFRPEDLDSGIVPVLDRKTGITLLVPVDSFKEQLGALRLSLQGKEGERPDILAIHICLDSFGMPNLLRVTPIEVKARTSKTSSGERGKYLTQASYFSEFLKQMRNAASESPLWGLAWRDLLCRLVDYGFRIYSQGGLLTSDLDWSKLHQNTIHNISAGTCQIEIDRTGRLIAVDASEKSNTYDDDSDGFKEAFVLSKGDALLLLQGKAPLWLDTVQKDLEMWGIRPEYDVAKEGASSASNSSDLDTEVPEVTEAVVGEDSHPTAAPESSEASEGIDFIVGHTIGEFLEEELRFQPGNTNLTQMNVGVVGDLGTGKTQLIQSLISQMYNSEAVNRGKHPNFLIFDYKRDYSDPKFVESVNATVINPFDIPLNIFDTRNSDSRTPWLERVKFFNDVLSKIFSNVGPVQHTNVKEAARSAYEQAKTFDRADPTLKEVFEAYKERVSKPDAPYAIMGDLVDGKHFIENSDAVVPFSDFLNGVVVINLSEVGADDKTKNMLVAIFLNLFYEHMLTIEKKDFLGSDNDRRFVDTMLLVDEADNIMKYEFPVLKQILLQGREFGVGVLLASQYLSHFKTSNENYAEPLSSWFIHKVPNIRLQELDSIGVSSSSNEVIRKIKQLDKHQCLYKSWGVDGKLMRGKPFYELKRAEKP